MQLLIMGAGYVGMSLLEDLKNESHQISITTTRKERVAELVPYGRVLVLHPTEDNGFKAFIDSCDAIVVLVAPKTHGQNYQETYVNTAKKILSSLKNREKPFYILYTSSISVCAGMQNEVTEDTALDPKLENAKILLETERLYLNKEGVGENVTTCILRLGGIFGPGRELTEHVRRYFSGKTMLSSGEESMNLIYLEDIVKAIKFCLDRSLTGIYHLVNDDHTAKKELFSNLCQSEGIPPPIWNAQAVKSGYVVSNKKIKEAGFVFKQPNIQETSLKS